MTLRQGFLSSVFVLGFASIVVPSSAALAAATIVSTNGSTRIGINDTGSLDNPSGVGIGYNFTGQGGRFGFNDALTPGCTCEGWGVSADGLGSGSANTSVGGTVNLTVDSTVSGAGTFQSNTHLGSGGLNISQTFTQAVQTATGALFRDTVVLTNTSGGTLSNVRYGRAMDWDVPPTEFNEYVTIKGTGTTTTLEHSHDDGFQSGNPLTSGAATTFGTGLIPDKTDADHSGPSDHGSYFGFNFGSIADGASYTFSIFYGAGVNEADALLLLSLISPELYSLGESNTAAKGTEFPTYAFAFSGVGGSVVVPPVPEPSTWIMMILGFAGLGFLGYRQTKKGVAAATA